MMLRREIKIEKKLIFNFVDSFVFVFLGAGFQYSIFQDFRN